MGLSPAAAAGGVTATTALASAREALDAWRTDPFAAAIAADPAGTYAAAAHDVLAAFGVDGVDDAPFALPEFGQDVTVEFDLRGRKWTDRQGQVKYFNTLQAWRLTAGQSEAEGASALEDAPSEDTTDYGAERTADSPF